MWSFRYTDSGLQTQVLDELDTTTFTEYRVSVYAASPKDWAGISSWIAQHGLADYGNNRWLVQVRVKNHES